MSITQDFWCRQPTASSYEITYMTEGALQSVAQIERLCFDLPWSHAGLHTLRLRPGISSRLAMMGSRIIGYTFSEYGVSTELLRIAVHTEYRRRGIGRALLAKITGHINSDSKLQRVETLVPLGSVGACLFFKSIGFTGRFVSGECNGEDGVEFSLKPLACAGK